MAPVVAVVAKVATAIFAKVTFAAVAKFIVTTALSIGVSKLIAKRAMKGAAAGGDGGGRVQLPPATDNKIPVVYGSAFIGGPIIDAMISADQKTMWYVVALAEVTDTSSGSQISYGDIYYDGKLVQFGTNGAVTALINNSTSPSQSDTRVNGFLDIYLYSNGSSSPVNSAFTAQQVLSVINGVPAGQAWGSTNSMTNCAFAIVKVKYSTDAGTTGLGALTAQVINTEGGQSTGIFRPGSAIKDYMLNTRYGCAIPLTSIDTNSLDALNIYSDQTINYIPVGGGSASQARYRINGPLDTGQNCLDNLQFLVDSCDSWLQYSELTGKWKVVINKAYDQSPDSQSVSNLFIVNSSNLVGGIEISPIDLNETYNQTEVAYPNWNIKDQTDYQIIDLFTDFPSVLSQNEAVNRLNITLPLVNNAVQAKYLAARRIFQSREDLVISFRTDYSGIQVEAGDVIRVYHETYGWDAINGFPDGKLFRVSEVIEEKDGNGNLYATFRAFEYNSTVYADNPVQDYVPAFNTGLKDPNIISAPCDPVITDFTSSESLVTGFSVESCVPEQGLVLYMDFNYGNNSNVLQHRLYRTVQQSDGEPFVNSPDIANANVTTVTIDVNDLVSGNYYWSVTARNNTSGKRSNASNVFNWTGANINPYDPNTGNGGITGNQIQANTITGNNIQANTITGNNISANTITGNNITANTITGNNITIGTLTGNLLANYTITNNNIANYTITNTNIANYTINGNNIANGGLSFDNFANNLITDEVIQQYSYYLADPTITPINIIIDLANVGINIDTYPDWEYPKYLNQFYTGNLGLYPYATGTSSTLEGYTANSTAQFGPGPACQFVIENGDFGWYVFEFIPFDGSTISPSLAAYVEYHNQFYSSGNCVLQLALCGTLAAQPDTDLYVNTQTLSTYNLIGGQPLLIDYENFVAGAVDDLTGVGIIGRIYSGTADLICTQGTFRIYKTYPPVSI